MRIGLVTAFYSEEYGGNEYYLAKEFAEQGNEVYIYVSRFTPQRYGLKKTSQGSGLPGVKVVRLPCLGLKMRGLVYLLGLSKQIAKDRIDIVHVQEWFMPLVLACRKHKNLVITQRLGNKKRTNHLFVSYTRFLYRLIKKKIKKVTCLTSEAKELFSHLSGSDMDVEIIPNGVDVEIFKPKQSDFRKRYLNGYDGLLILAVGRLSHEKGFDVLIKSVSEIDKDFRLVIVGFGPDDKKLKQLAEKKTNNKIVFIKRVEHERMPELYSSADILVAPSRNEPFGFMTLESLACGTPVIGSNTGGMKDVITDIVGIKVKPENIDELRKAIIKMSNPEIRNEFRKNCVSYIRNRYSWKIISDRYLKIYEK